MGGAGRASSGSESHLLNPATVAHLQSYHIDYYYRFARLESQGSTRDWSVNVADGNQDSLIRAGFAYINTQRNGLGDSRFREENFILSLGGFVYEQLALGIQAHYWAEHGPQQPKDILYQFSTGVVWNPSEVTGIALVFHNMLDKHEPVLRPEVGTGFVYIYEEIFRARLDLIQPQKFNPNKKGIIALGAESAFPIGFRFRFGARWDDVQKQTWLTGGLAFEGPRLALGFSYEKDTQTRFYDRQSFDLKLVF